MYDNTARCLGRGDEARAPHPSELHYHQSVFGVYIVDFEKVEFDMEPIAKVFGPFASKEAATNFWDKYLSTGYSCETGILFMKEDEE